MFTRSLLSYLTIIGIAITFIGCSNSSTNPDDTLQIPTTYDSTGWTSNTTEQYALRAHSTELIGLLRGIKTEADILTDAQVAPSLNALAAAMNPADHDRIVEFVQAAVAACGHTYTWTADPASASPGGVYGGRLYDMYGRDLKEMVEKALFASVFKYQALQIMKGVVTPSSVDQLVALFGANPSFPNGSTSAIERDAFAAGYAARRDKNDGKGLYSQFKNAALKAKAASADPTKYASQLSEALQEMRVVWERCMMATAVNYAYTTISTLASTNLTDSTRSLGMHTYGECVGIVAAYANLNAADRTASGNAITSMLNQLLAPKSASPTCYLFWQQPQSSLQNIEAFLLTVQNTYGFTAEEMADFKNNWVSVQKR